ncbi:hypothetical protein CEXT_310001 [Caerostris extrusa]|uniref:Uncharacterized protein n=1 Tax=Caerostris extrusa TaxID=172846 RepID=A0AAV4P4Y3_CAEEX|nr:hypothetical protein CEXT_310001 [Caerostris extrusa]
MDHKASPIKPGPERRKWLPSTVASSGSRPNENGPGLRARVNGFGTYFGRVVEKSHFPCFTRLKLVVIRISIDFLGTATCLQERLTEAHKS